MHEKRTIFSGPQNPLPITCNEKQHCAVLNHRHVSRLIFAQLCFIWGLLHVFLLQASRWLETLPPPPRPRWKIQRLQDFLAGHKCYTFFCFTVKAKHMFSFTSPFTSDIWGVFVIPYSATHSHLLQTLCFWEELYKSVVASWMVFNEWLSHVSASVSQCPPPLHHVHWDLPNTIFYKGIVRAYIII